MDILKTGSLKTWSLKMMIFQNKRVRERWIVDNGVVSCVLLGRLYIEPSM